MGFCYSAPQMSGGQERDCERAAKRRKSTKLRHLPSFYYAFTMAEVRKERQVFRANLERLHSIVISFLGPSFNAHSAYIFGDSWERHCNDADNQQRKTKNISALLTLVIAVRNQIGFNKDILPWLASQQLASNDIKSRSVEDKASSWHKHCSVPFLHCHTCSSLNFAERLKLIYSSLRGEVVPHFENNGTWS